MAPTPTTGHVVWINGFPGVGKLTIARELQKLMVQRGGEALVIDNHQLIDPVTLPRDHPDYQTQRQAQRTIAFEQHLFSKENWHPERATIFTDFQSDNELGALVAAEFRAAAERAGRRLLPVYVTCERDELLRRVASPERVGGGKGKLLDKGVLEGFLDGSGYRVFEWPGVDCVRIDATTMKPVEAAGVILRHML